MGEAYPPKGCKLTKKELRKKVSDLQVLCEFLIEKIQPDHADGLIVVAKPSGYGFEWNPKKEKS